MVNAYRLEDLDQRPIAKPWNVFNLKKYYFLLLYRKYELLVFLFRLSLVNSNKFYEGLTWDAKIAKGNKSRGTRPCLCLG